MKHILGKYSKSTLTNVQEGDVQPNAVDLRLDKVFKISDNLFEIDNDTKVHRGSEPVEPNADGWFELEPGAYEVIMENVISVADGEAGFVITRSTLNRNGVFLTSGLYDSGYGIDVNTGEAVGGVMAGVMHVNVGPALIKKGTRVGQYIMWNAETLSLYNGSYGNHKEHDTKYQ
ncbi:Dcd Deoxycytidine deaminase [uncultured Caudovirales phage]|uniref:Dcd Deoxycytidine deaminase n=1 Tax=uncultured Caudovirales phage TaxID=2100421 RepID=A0A6J5KXP8_9CAUD|nr:Dcd Deoxycytidine deaminase [uncultured Caudovirales phage]